MASPAPKKPRINLNLLHPQGVSQKFISRFFKWLISYGRFIVVGVEVVVIGAFIMRFSLDAKLDELKKKINNDIPYVTNLGSDEALIRQTQFRLSTIGKELDQSTIWTGILKELSAKMPSNVTFINLSIQKDTKSQIFQFHLTATTTSNVYMGQYLSSLKRDSHFKDINLANVNFDQGQLLFVITGNRLN